VTPVECTVEDCVSVTSPTAGVATDWPATGTKVTSTPNAPSSARPTAPAGGDTIAAVAWATVSGDESRDADVAGAVVPAARDGQRRGTRV